VYKPTKNGVHKECSQRFRVTIQITVETHHLQSASRIYRLCSVPFENKLYLVGGQTTIMECYDLEQNEWRETAPMIGRKMECDNVIMNG